MSTKRIAKSRRGTEKARVTRIRARWATRNARNTWNAFSLHCLLPAGVVGGSEPHSGVVGGKGKDRPIDRWNSGARAAEGGNASVVRKELCQLRG